MPQVKREEVSHAQKQKHIEDEAATLLKQALRKEKRKNHKTHAFEHRGDHHPDLMESAGSSSWLISRAQMLVYRKQPTVSPSVETGDSFLEVDEPWETFNDAMSALRAAEWIGNASEYDEPFFLAVGFHRPHIPYIYPKEFEFEGDVKFPPDDYHITKDIPACAPHDWTGEGTRYADLWSIKPSITDHNFQSNLSSLCTAVPFEYQRGMKHAYYSCIQYIDHLVGQLIGALQEEGLYEQTTIIFWGDHGTLAAAAVVAAAAAAVAVAVAAAKMQPK